MRLKRNFFLALLGLMIATAAGTRCTPPPAQAPETTEEPEANSPLARPTTSESPNHTSPLAPPTETRTPLPTDVPPARTAVSIPSQAAKAVTWAQADLAARLDIPPDQIEIVTIEFVQWRDSSLGCPQPGMMYAQVITPGYRILLQSEEKRYEYHAAQGRDSAILCKSDIPASPDASGPPLPTRPPAEGTH